jgi:glycosyltransferase involved in cell wall biosynthesis
MARKVVHLVYPHDRRRIGAPHVIGWRLAEFLGREHEVRLYDWDRRGPIRPGPGDVLIGHLNPDPGTVVSRSLRLPGWGRKILLGPFNLDPRQVAFIDRSIGLADVFCAITGPYWAERIATSRFAHWVPKFRPVDLAVDPADFPRIKAGFAPRGRRSILYVGHTRWQKNPRYLEAIAARLPGVPFGWCGSGGRPLRGFQRLGPQDFASEAARALVARYDFTITVGAFDANPTTILESMAWGLIPVCTPTSGYAGIPSIVNVPLGDPDGAAAVLRGLLEAEEGELLATQARNLALVRDRYTWERFAAAILAEVEASDSPPLGERSAGNLAWLRTMEGLSPETWKWLRLGVKRAGGLRTRPSGGSTPRG